MSGYHHTFTDKKNIFLYRKFSFTQNQKLCKFFDLWAFLFLRQHLSSRTSFQKRFLLQNRKSLWKVPKKNTILPPKGNISISSQGQKCLSTPSFPELGALSQKKCLCSNSQLSNCKTPVSGLMFCIKRSIEHTCEVVAHVCVKFTFHLINGKGGGFSLLTIWNCSYAAFLGIQYMAFRLDVFAVFDAS